MFDSENFKMWMMVGVFTLVMFISGSGIHYYFDYKKSVETAQVLLEIERLHHPQDERQTALFPHHLQHQSGMGSCSPISNNDVNTNERFENHDRRLVTVEHRSLQTLQRVAQIESRMRSRVRPLQPGASMRPTPVNVVVTLTTPSGNACNSGHVCEGVNVRCQLLSDLRTLRAQVRDVEADKANIAEERDRLRALVHRALNPNLTNNERTQILQEVHGMSDLESLNSNRQQQARASSSTSSTDSQRSAERMQRDLGNNQTQSARTAADAIVPNSGTHRRAGATTPRPPSGN